MTKLYYEIDNSVTNILFIDFSLTLTIIFIYKHQLSLFIRAIYVIYLKVKNKQQSLNREEHRKMQRGKHR